MNLEISNPMDYHVALYIRLSKEDESEGPSESVNNQQSLLTEFAEQHRLSVYDTYIDDGWSGTNFHRPAFQQMLSDIESGKINCVIVKDLSRLGRNSIDTGYYIEQYFPAHNVRFIAVTDQFDSENPDNLHGGILIPLKNMINEAYALDIGRKIKAQQRQAMKDGEYVGARAPYGYRKSPDNCHKLLIDEGAAPVVRQIFRWAYGKVSLNEIVLRLNESQIPPPSHYKKSTGEITHANLIGNGAWQTRTVARLLGNEVYTGDLVQGKTKIVDHQQVKAGKDNLIIAQNTHEAIVSHEIFDAVQAHLRQAREKSLTVKVNSYTPNIFKGKVFCADCGKSLHRQRAKRKTGPDVYWFHCLSNTRVAKNSCQGVMIKESELTAVVTDILEHELSTVLGKSFSLFQLEQQTEKTQKQLKSDIAARQQEIQKQQCLIRSLYENYVQGILTSQEYFKWKVDYEVGIANLSEEIQRLEKERLSLDQQLEHYRAMEQDSKILAQNHMLTADLIERLIERIEITHNRDIKVIFSFQNEFSNRDKVVAV